MIDMVLMQMCAAGVEPHTLSEVVLVESGGEPLALKINGVARARPASLDAAVAAAQNAIDSGYTVNIGLMQLNGRQLKDRRLGVRQAFDVCINLQAGASIFSKAYKQAAKHYGEGGRAVRAAMAVYHAGTLSPAPRVPREPWHPDSAPAAAAAVSAPAASGSKSQPTPAPSPGAGNTVAATPPSGYEPAASADAANTYTSFTLSYRLREGEAGASVR